MTSYVTPKKNSAFIIYVGLQDYLTSGRLKANPTLAAGDAQVSIDGGAFANLTTLPTVTPALGRGVKISLSAAEMNGDNITVVLSDQTSPPEWCDVILNIQTSASQIDDLALATSTTASAIRAAVGLASANLDTQLSAIAGYIDTEVSTIVTQTSAASIRSAVGLASANLDTQLGAIAGYIDTEIGTLQTTATAIKAKTDNLPAAPAATSDIPTANANADALLDRADGVETGLTPRQAFRLVSAVLFGKVSGGGTGTEVFRDFGDTKARITATVDSSGNRTAITRDAT